MSYQALYRKYRSKTFEEVYGQQHIVKTLKNALLNNKIAHAYLFSGPRGTGKTSIARLLAKALNCETGLGNICNNCDCCKSINSNSNPDIIEIDAASNSRVEEIRNLIEQVKYAPIKSKYKVYIIDEVHMLSNSAFNALLKTLEEPPLNVVFILATTEPYKVLPTIVSRCQRFDFTKIDDYLIKDRLTEICKLENINIDEDSLMELSSLADGGMRDALSLLDETIAYCGNHITYSEILNIFGIISKEEKCNFIKNILLNNQNNVFNLFNNYYKNGLDIKHFNDDLINILKDVLIYKITNNLENLRYINENSLKEISELASIQQLNEIINKLLEASSEFKNITNLHSFYQVILLNLTIKVTKENKQIISQLSNNNNLTIKKEANTNNKNEEEEKIIINQKNEPTPNETINNITNETTHNLDKKEDSTISKTVEPKDSLINKNEKISSKQDNNLLTGTGTERYNPKEFIKENEEINKDELIYYDDELLIKAIVKSSKEEKLKLRTQWQTLSDLRSDSKYAPFIFKLKACALFSLCDELLVISSDFDSIVNNFNSKKNNQLICEIISKLLNHKINVYTINLDHANKLQKKYYDLYQVNKLPLKEEIGKLF